VAACTAVAGASYSLGRAGPHHAPPPQTAPSIPGENASQREVRALPAVASFGWLPDGYREYGIRTAGASDGVVTIVSAARPGFTRLQLHAPIQLTVTTRGVSRGTPGPVLRGKASVWLARPGSGPSAEMAWEYAPARWAVLAVRPEVTRDPARIATIAANARFAENPRPVRFPLRFDGPLEQFEPIELHAFSTESGTRGFGVTLVGRSPRKWERIWIEVDPSSAERHELPTPTEVAGVRSVGVTVGRYYVRALAVPGPNTPRSEDELIALVRKAAPLPAGGGTTEPFG
ncbi:hypothetical protein AB0J52_32990, partial [Spirillospora sp. NPDC049652]